jgi:hypothetical protein
MANCLILYGRTGAIAHSKNAGPFRIATELRKNGYSVRCVDITVFDDPIVLGKALKNLIDKDTLWVGISGTFLFDIFGFEWQRLPDKDHTLPNNDAGLVRFIDFVKSLNPNIKFITGGSRKHHLVKYGFVNFEGYVDQKIVDYTNWLAKKHTSVSLEFYSNVIKNKEYDDFYSSNIIFEPEDIVFTNEALPIEISRGCIFKCKFCSFPLNGKAKGEGMRDPDVLLAEFIRNYEMFGTTNYTFADDTYNDSIEKITTLYEKVYSKLPFKINFTTYARLDLMMRFPESIDIMKRSGLKSVVFGIETLNPKSAKTIGKGIDPREQIKFIRQIKNDQWADVMTSSGFILGLPHHTNEDLDYIQDWIFSDDNPLDHWHIDPLHLSPPDIVDQQYSYSELDTDYKKYGYEIIVDPTQHLHNQVRWVNNNSGLTQEKCSDVAANLMTQSYNHKKYRAGSFGFSEVAEFLDSDTVLKTPVADYASLFSTWRNEKKEQYITRLFESFK